MLTLGIDPGTALLGYGFVRAGDDPIAVEFGAIATSSNLSMQNRLLELYNGLIELVDKHHPDVVAIEQLFFARNVTTALTVGQARGVVLLAAAQCKIPVFEYKPNEVKLTVAGYGGADKQQVQEMVRIQLGLREIPSPDDAADALAVALCHVASQHFRTLTESGKK